MRSLFPIVSALLNGWRYSIQESSGKTETLVLIFYWKIHINLLNNWLISQEISMILFSNFNSLFSK